MASKPYPDVRRGVWRMKVRREADGPWEAVTLGKDPRLKGPRPPKSPPAWIAERARELAEAEYRARHGLGRAKAARSGLEGYALAYLEAYAKTKREGSAKQARRHALRFVAWARARGITAVQAVSRAHCRDYLESRIGLVSHNTLRVERNYLMPIWGRAVEDGLIEANPWDYARTPGKPEPVGETFWSPGQVRAIAAASPMAWQRDLVFTLAYTGIRISAALAMEWGWIDWGAGTVTVPAAHDKACVGYTLAMAPVAADVLRRRHALVRGPLVFPSSRDPSRPYSYDTAKDAIRRAVAKAGVPGGTPHDLRHTYGRWLALKGVPVNVIMAQLGHRNIKTTERYISVGHAEAKSFMDALSDPPA
jgi:integrase